MQRDYSYELTQPPGMNFAAAFTPQLTPKLMLELGVFGGKYMTDCKDEFPKSWFAKAKLSPRRRNPALNFFGVDASQPLSVWREKRWIHPSDPRGLFHWYCRYYIGRRMADETIAKSVAGKACAATPSRSGAIAIGASSSVAFGSDRRLCIGPTTAG